MAEAKATTKSAGRALAVVALQLWAMLRSAEAATHVVGDTAGWSTPSNGATFYSSWASRQTFQVGDILVFNFISGQHDVAVVTASHFSNCDTSSPITFLSTPPVNYTLNSTGTTDFICTHSGHCAGGQKLSVTVGTASGPTTSPPSTTTPSPPPPPPANSSTGHMYVPYLVILTSMAISLIS